MKWTLWANTLMEQIIKAEGRKRASFWKDKQCMPWKKRRLEQYMLEEIDSLNRHYKRHTVHHDMNTKSTIGLACQQLGRREGFDIESEVLLLLLNTGGQVWRETQMVGPRTWLFVTIIVKNCQCSWRFMVDWRAWCESCDAKCQQQWLEL